MLEILYIERGLFGHKLPANGCNNSQQHTKGCANGRNIQNPTMLRPFQARRRGGSRGSNEPPLQVNGGG